LSPPIPPVCCDSAAVPQAFESRNDSRPLSTRSTFSPLFPSFGTGNVSSIQSYLGPINVSSYPASDGLAGARLSPSSAPYGGAGSRAQPQPSVDPDLAAAKAEYGLAVNRFKSTLNQNSEYQAAVVEEKAARAEMSGLQQRSDASPEERAAVAARLLDAKSRLARLTQAAAGDGEQALGADHRERAAPAAVPAYGR
jgi:hypothetical protein